MVGVLVDRKGNIDEVAVGDFGRVYLPDIGRQRASSSRLRGLRLIVAKPQRGPSKPVSGKRTSFVATDYPLDRDFIVDLEKLQLDLVLQIEAMPDGLPGRVVMGSLSAESRHVLHSYRDVHQIDVDFQRWVVALENELQKKVTEIRKAAQVAGDREAAVLVGVYTTAKREWQPSMEELKELSRTAGVRVVDVVTQQRSQLDARTIVGKGKLEDICLNALHKGAEVLIFDRDLSPSQLNAITDVTDLKILDRTMLILDIFARRAQTRGGKLQVELAQLQYSLPRLAKKQTGLSRLTGGIGGQGPGETKLEVDRRRVKEKIARLEDEIEKLRGQRTLRRKKREEKEVPTIAIVGYTNAGKSTLLNALTGADVYAKDELFATLDPTSRRLRFPTEREVILIDTVGFIRDLPEGLINAFRATLEELHDADLLLHVVDGTDPQKERHIQVVEGILKDLDIMEPERILVMNKCDQLDPKKAENEARWLGALPISAKTRQGFEELLNACAKILWHAHVTPKREVWAPVRQKVDTNLYNL